MAGTFARSIAVYPLDSLFSTPELVRSEALTLVKAKLRLSPNPSQGTSQLIWEGLDNNPTQIQLFDLQGRPLWHKTFLPNGTKGQEQISLPERLPAGVYYLRVTQNKRSKSLRLSLLR